MTEKEILTRMRDLKFELAETEARQKQLKAEFDYYKFLVARMLVDQEAKTTTKFDDIGSVSLLAPLVRADIDKVQQEEAFDFVRKCGEPEIIKLSIHPQSLYGFVGRIIEQGIPIPKCISYWFEPSVRCNFKPMSGSR